MKKILAIVCAAVLVFCLASCGEPVEQTELTVFAAASLQEALTQLGEQYMAKHPDVKLLFNFDSSGTLSTQIKSGAYCDIFISAGQKQMDELSVPLQERFDLLENKVTLAVPEGNPAQLQSFEDLAQALTEERILLTMGNADVPVGQYTKKILNYYNLSEEALAAAGCLTYGSNAKEVTTQVAEGMVDCGMVYATDAFSAGLTVVDTATADMCGQVIYPAAVLKLIQNPEIAAEFLEYLCSDAGDAVFERVGFTPLA